MCERLLLKHTCTHILSRWFIAFCIDKLAIDAHLVDLVQAHRIIEEIRLAETPSVREDEVLKFRAQFIQAIMDRLERRSYILRIILRLDLLQNVKAFLQEGDAECLRSRYGPPWTKELSVDAFAVEVIETSAHITHQRHSRIDLAQFLS